MTQDAPRSAHHAGPSGWYDLGRLPCGTPAVPFVKKPELLAEIERHHATGAVSAELARMLDSIARGVWRRRRPTDDEDDFVQDCVLHLAYAAPLRRVQPDPRALAFLIRCAASFAHKCRLKQIKAVARREALAAAAARTAPAVRRSPAQAERYAALHDSD